jgi:uncharacterized protein (TIGR02246 family)
MRIRRAVLLHAVLPAVLAALPARPGWSAEAGRAEREIAAFNDQLRASILRMDNAAAMALWADDGVTLLPGTPPIVGKQAIAKHLDDVVAQLSGYRVLAQEQDFHDLRIHGDWATEWGTTHQTVQPPDHKPVLDIYGKILLVLHRGPAGRWLIEEEAWNNSPAPGK